MDLFQSRFASHFDSRFDSAHVKKGVDYDALVSVLTARDASASRETIFIVDCRRATEFDGGHIIGAINIPSDEYMLRKPETTTKVIKLGYDIAKTWLVSHQPDEKYQKPIMFHCQFSQVRGPTQMKWFRTGIAEAMLERKRVLAKEEGKASAKEKTGSQLFPNIFLLEGGYDAFHAYLTKKNLEGFLVTTAGEYKVDGKIPYKKADIEGVEASTDIPITFSLAERLAPLRHLRNPR